MKIGKVFVFLLSIFLMVSSVAAEVDKALLRAIRENDPVGLRRAIKKGADANAKVQDGVPVIVVGAEMGDPEVFLALLVAGASVDEADSAGRTALMAAVDVGQADIVQLLLASGADPALTDNTGLSALDRAASLKEIDFVNLIKLYGDDQETVLPCEYRRYSADSVEGEQEISLPVDLERARELIVDSMIAYGFIVNKDKGLEIVGRRVFPQFSMNWGAKNNFTGEKFFVNFTESVDVQETRIRARTQSPPVGRSNRQWTTAIFRHAECLYSLLDAGFLKNTTATREEDGTLVLREGTPIRLRFRRHLLSKTAKQEDRLEFQVASDVSVDGDVVVRKGTKAFGIVSEAKRSRGFNRSGALGVEVNSVLAVDGTEVILRSIVDRYKGNNSKDSEMFGAFLAGGVLGLWLTKGEDVLLRAGTEASAFVGRDAVIFSQ